MIKRFLAIGDVVADGGVKAIMYNLRTILENYHIDFVIANGENSSGNGIGISITSARRLFRGGVDVITLGNHTWGNTEMPRLFESFPNVIRPANYPSDKVPGKGFVIIEKEWGKVAVVNLMGQVFMEPGLNNPFTTAENLVNELRKETPIIIVDFHAEATSEKVAMGWFLAGKVSAVFGTHTHIQTADERILPGRTAYITDIGMTGSRDSVIGDRVEPVVKRFVTGMRQKFKPAEGNIVMEGIIFEIETDTGKARSIERIKEKFELPEYAR